MLAFWLLLAMDPLGVLQAQSLAPRAYLITPLHSNAVTLTSSFFSGGLDFNGVVPITGATGTYSVPIFSYYHSFGFLGRSANILVALPYGVGTFQGSVVGTEQQIYRSGLLDANFRLSVNLKGGPAMPVQGFVKWKQKTLLGVSLTVIAPTGQYDPSRLINWGINRWAFKPEIGFSQRRGKWVVDGYAGVWLFTTNGAFFSSPAPAPQTLSPIGSFEGHLSRDLGSPRFWASLDGNFWFGGTATLNGVPNPKTKQTSSRIGATLAVPISKHQAIKMNYSIGTYVRFGGNYHNFSVAWQYSWLGRPK
ncbi:MAG: transporter [Acidobacteriia bacterium]|nr:transporter [Terriglobia bacterium]